MKLLAPWLVHTSIQLRSELTNDMFGQLDCSGLMPGRAAIRDH